MKRITMDLRVPAHGAVVYRPLHRPERRCNVKVQARSNIRPLALHDPPHLWAVRLFLRSPAVTTAVEGHHRAAYVSYGLCRRYRDYRWTIFSSMLIA